jgi:hypothetical protein
MQLTGGQTWVLRCRGQITDGTSTLFVASANFIVFRECLFQNTTGSQIVSTLTNSNLSATNSAFAFPMSTTGGSTFGAGYCGFSCGGATDSIALAFNGTGAESHTLRFCYLISETKACLALGAGNVTQTTSCEMITDAANAVTGLGNWFYDNISFQGATTGVSVATQTPVGLSGPRTQLVGGAQFMSGSGSPNGSVTAPKGSYYLRTDGSSATTRAYINTNSGTAWTGVMTVS